MTQHLDIWPTGGGPINDVDPVYLDVMGDLMQQVRLTHQGWWSRSGAGALVPSYAFKEGVTPRVTWGRPAGGVSVRLTRAPVLEGTPNVADVAFDDVRLILDAVQRRFDLGPYPPIGPLDESVARVDVMHRRLAQDRALCRELFDSMRDRLEPRLARNLDLELEHGRTVASAIDRYRWLYAIETSEREDELLSALLPIRWNPGWAPGIAQEQRDLFERASAEGVELDRRIKAIYDAGDATPFSWSREGSAGDGSSRPGGTEVGTERAHDDDRGNGAVEEDDRGLLPAAHPAFTAHFSADIYEQVDHEFAPHGTDEGYDLIWQWVERRDELTDHTALVDLLEHSDLGEVIGQLDEPEVGLVPSAGGQIDAATFIVGAAFTLLRLTGQLDEGGKELALRALEILLARYGPMPDLVRQQEDLRAWPAGP